MKIADTGIDPQVTFKEFIKKEIIAPLVKPNDINYKLSERPERLKEWSLGTTKHYVSPEKVPKFQQYKDYNFPSVSNEAKINYYKKTISTDQVAFKDREVFENNKEVLSTMPNIEKGMKFSELKSKNI